MMSVMECV